MILPLPESKRKQKVAETKYEIKSYSDIVSKIEQVQGELSAGTAGLADQKRFEDKTEEEMVEEMARKRK